MNLYFDVDAGYFVTGPGTRERVDALSFKRGDTCSIAVRFVSGIVVQELGAGAAGKIGMKEEGEYDADFVASDSAWTKTGTGTSTVYTFELNLNTSELNTLLADDGTEGNDVASVELMFEMEYTVGGVTTSSNTITATVHNDVVKGDETGPTLAGGTVPPVNQTYATHDHDPGGSNNGLRFTAAVGGEAGNQRAVGFYEHSSVVIEVIEGNTILIGYVPDVTTAGEIITEFNEILEALNLMSVDNLPGSSGAGTLPEGGLVETNLSGGIDATEGYLGTMKVDSDYLYVVASVTSGVPTWKKIALSAL